MAVQTLVPIEATVRGEPSNLGDPAGGLQLEPQVCCLCEVSAATPIGIGEDFEYRTSADTFTAVRCDECGLVYLDPRPHTSELPQMYPADYHAFDFNAESHGLAARIRAMLETRRLSRWLSDLPDDARVLDVGCGDGFHLKLMTARWPSLQVSGLDLDERAVDAARAADLDVYQGRIEDDLLPESHFDMVLLVMTLEHVADPVRTLRSIRRVLRPGGRVVIVTDNTQTAAFRIFGGSHWGGYHFPRHWNLFNRDCLRQAAAKAEFDVHDISTNVNPVNWVYSIHNILSDYRAPGWLRRRFTLKSVVSLGCFTIVDYAMNLLGHGANLQGVLINSADTDKKE